jgi:hypothetical protein
MHLDSLHKQMNLCTEQHSHGSSKNSRSSTVTWVHKFLIKLKLRNTVKYGYLFFSFMSVIMAMGMTWVYSKGTCLLIHDERRIGRIRKHRGKTDIVSGFIK